MAATFWQVKYSLKLGEASLRRYPVGQKFCQNCSIWHGFRDTSIFGFVIFAKNSKIQNICHFLVSEIFVETWDRLVFTDSRSKVCQNRSI